MSIPVIELPPRCFISPKPISGKIGILIKDSLSDDIIDYIAHEPFDEISLSYCCWQDASRLVKYKSKIKHLHIGSDDIDWQSISELSCIERLWIDINDLRWIR